MTEVERILSKKVISPDFLKEETLCDFPVDLFRKKTWLIHLDMLLEIDRVCKKNNIKYFLGYGSLLGAIRHKGFVPWDDDADICMFRDDFEKFKNLQHEFDSPYFIQTPESDKGFFYSDIKLRNSNTGAINKAYRWHGINFGYAIDIYPIDNVILEGIEERQQKIKELNIRNSNYMRSTNRNPTPEEYDRFKDYNSNPSEDISEINRIVTQYNNQETEYVGVIVDSLYHWSRNVWKKDDFNTFLEWDFEGFKLPVPMGYERILSTMYGDWKKFPPLDESLKWHDRNIQDPDVSYKDLLKKMGINS